MKHNHYEEAAKHYTAAAHHQLEAHKAHQEGNDEKAALHAHAASGHHAQATSHATDAAKRHIELIAPLIDHALPWAGHKLTIAQDGIDDWREDHPTLPEKGLNQNRPI